MLSTPQPALFYPTALQPGIAGLTNRQQIEAIRKRQLRILIIDDTPNFRESMVYQLREKYGAVVVDVASGHQGVDLVRAGGIFDIIFLDLIMPEMPGLKTYEALRQIDSVPRVVLMSAHPGCDDWKKAEELSLELIEKPLRKGALLSILNDL